MSGITKHRLSEVLKVLCKRFLGQFGSGSSLHKVMISIRVTMLTFFEHNRIQGEPRAGILSALIPDPCFYKTELTSHSNRCFPLMFHSCRVRHMTWNHSSLQNSTVIPKSTIIPNSKINQDHPLWNIHSKGFNSTSILDPALLLHWIFRIKGKWLHSFYPCIPQEGLKESSLFELQCLLSSNHQRENSVSLCMLFLLPAGPLLAMETPVALQPFWARSSWPKCLQVILQGNMGSW